MPKPKLYIHVGRATHFLKWEIPEFKKHFTLVDQPSPDIPLLSFGPDILEEAAALPAKMRFAVLFPGFGRNPLYNLDLRKQQLKIIKENFKLIFINPGPLELAYKELNNKVFYPFSVDMDMVKPKSFRKKLDTLLHVSNDGRQKDWQRSERIMQLTGLKHEVFPPRDDSVYEAQVKKNELKNKLRKIVHLPPKKYLPHGYLDHRTIVKKYQAYDGFVHIARDIKDPVLIDGKYTASLIEAGVTGCVLFWHDTLGLGNNLETVFNLPLNEKKAAAEIMNIRSSLDIAKHSRLISEEMIDTFNPQRSVGIRAESIKKALDS